MYILYPRQNQALDRYRRRWVAKKFDAEVIIAHWKGACRHG